MKVQINQHQYNALRKIWLYCFGNNSKHCTMANHKFIQNILERGEDNREAYIQGYVNMKEDKDHIFYSQPEKHAEHILSEDCIKSVDLILENKIDESIKFTKSL